MVFGADGQPCKVLKAHDVLLGEPCYEVEFDDGTVVVASGDHLWSTADRAARISMANAARHDAEPSRARDRLALLDGLIAKGDPDELVTAAELAAEIDGMSMEFVCNVARWRGVVPMGSKPVTMRQYYRSTGKTVVKTRPARAYRRGTCSPRCKAAPTSRPSGSGTSVPAREVVTTRRSAIPSRWAATSTTRSAYAAPSISPSRNCQSTRTCLVAGSATVTA